MKAKGSMITLKQREERTAWIMLLPNTAALIVFVFIPMIWALYISFHSWDGISAMKPVMFKNYIKLFDDRNFRKSLVVTLKYALMYVPSLFLGSLGLAILVNSLRIRLQELVRTLIFFPYCISAIISGLVWGFFFDPLNGYVNQILRFLGYESQDFLGDPKQALACIAVTAFWINIGYNMVVLLAAVKDIPAMYYESASLDGANGVQKFFYITLPHLKNASSFVLVVTTINSFQVFDQIKMLTKGGPNKSTATTVLFIFERAFTQNKIGYASAAAFILFIVLMILSLIQLKLISSDEA